MSRYVSSPESQCVGKRTYSSKASARRALKKWRSRPGGGVSANNVYRCPHCDHYHVGTRSKAIRHHQTYQDDEL